MTSPPRLCAAALTDHPASYLALVQAGLEIRCHADLLDWLQGDVQHYLPHDILMTGWGNFEEGSVQHDVVSRLPGVRSYAEGTACLPFLLAKVNDCWVSGGRQPTSFSFSQFSYLLGSDALPDSFCEALRRMGSAVVHGISDRRGQNDCVYVFLSAGTRQPEGTDEALSATVKVLLPFIDTALRQINHLPEQRGQAPTPGALKAASEDSTGLSERGKPDHGLGGHGKNQFRNRQHPEHQRLHRQKSHAADFSETECFQSRAGGIQSEPGFSRCLKPTSPMQRAHG